MTSTGIIFTIAVIVIGIACVVGAVIVSSLLLTTVLSFLGGMFVALGILCVVAMTTEIGR